MVTLLPCGATILDPGDTPGDTITTARQIEFNGLLLGSGTPYRWKELTGWDDQPGLDLGDTVKPSEHGDFPGLGFFQARLPALTMQVVGESTADTEELLKLLRQRMAYNDTEQPLLIRDSGELLVADARVVDRKIPHQPQRTLGVAPAAVLWRCSDPLRRSRTGRSLHLVPAVTTGGLPYPLEYPLDYGTEGGGASGTAVNDGDISAPAVVTFTGPASGDGYGVVLDGLLLKFDLPLTAGETLTVDTGTGTVLLNGSSDRTGWITPDSVPPTEWRIPPGSSTVSLIVVSGSGPTTAVDIEWYDTYQ